MTGSIYSEQKNLEEAAAAVIKLKKKEKKTLHLAFQVKFSKHARTKKKWIRL